MANPSVTYTFTNSTTADGTQVSQNFTDLINGMTDGTKSFSIDALTCAGACLFNGAVTLGNAAGDDITHTGSLASSIPIKADSTYDLGDATHAMRVLYSDKIQGGSTAGCEIVGKTDGAAPAATMVGAPIGTQRAGTNGNSYSTRSTTALLSTSGAILAIGFNKGSYILSFQCGGYNPDATAHTTNYFLRIGGTQVTSTHLISGNQNERIIFGMSCVPIEISADGITVDVVAQCVGLTGTWGDPVHEAWVTRKA